MKILPINKMCRNNNEKLQKPRPVSMKGLDALRRGVTKSCGMQITDTELYLFKSTQICTATAGNLASVSFQHYISGLAVPAELSDS